MFLCSKINTLEWSGILYYNIEGDVSNLSKLHVTAKSVFLKDIGTVAFTSYETSGEEIEYMMSNPDILSSTLGKIHSHNSMPVFHSGTDVEDLWDNTETHNYYLSFIVNNAGDVEVKLAWRSKELLEQTSVFHLTGHNGELITKTETKTVEQLVLITADGDITIHKNEPEDWFIARYEKVIEEKIVQDKAKESAKVSPQYRGYYPPTNQYVNKQVVGDKHSQFLAEFMTNGRLSGLDFAMNNVERLLAEDLEKWENNIKTADRWDTYFLKFFGQSYKNTPEIIEQCIKILSSNKKYTIENSYTVNFLCVLLNDIRDEFIMSSNEELEYNEPAFLRYMNE